VVHKIFSEVVHAYMNKTQRETKLRISWLLMVRREIFLRSLLFIEDGLDLAKKPSQAAVHLRRCIFCTQGSNAGI
jgi:hypothetical protein